MRFPHIETLCAVYIFCIIIQFNASKVLLDSSLNILDTLLKIPANAHDINTLQICFILLQPSNFSNLANLQSIIWTNVTQIVQLKKSNKYTSSLQLIVLPLDHSYLELIPSWFGFDILQPNVMFLILYTQHAYKSKHLHISEASFSPAFLNLPATKVILLTEAHSLTYRILCNGYCRTSDEHLNIKSFQRIILNPLSLHRKYFRLGNFQEIEAIPKSYDHAGTKKIFRILGCQFDITRRRYKSKTVTCSSMDIALHILSKSHNISLKYFPEKKNELKFGTYYINQQFITNVVGSFDLLSHLVYNQPGLYYMLDDYQVIIYCKDIEGTMDSDSTINIWIAPFTIDLWILIIGITVCVVIFAKSYYESWNGYISTTLLYLTYLLGQCPTEVIKLKFAYTIIIILGMCLSNFYGNSILNILLIGSREFESLKEILDAGYKVVYFQHSKLPNFRNYIFHEYESAFRIRGIENKLNNETFYFVNEKYSSNTLAGFLVQKFVYLFNKMGWDVSLNHAVSELVHAKGHLYKNALCKHIPERLNNRLLFSFMSTVNRHWLRETLLRIQMSGLLELWDEWRRWKLDVKSWVKYRQKPPMMTNDSIDGLKLCPVYAFVGVMWVFGFILFVGEWPKVQ